MSSSLPPSTLVAFTSWPRYFGVGRSSCGELGIGKVVESVAVPEEIIEFRGMEVRRDLFIVMLQYHINESPGCSQGSEVHIFLYRSHPFLEPSSPQLRSRLRGTFLPGEKCNTRGKEML